jgi:transcriptional regulator with XRE-family HTH domain
LRQATVDTIHITMTPQQSRMARAALGWSLDEFAAQAGVGRVTVARFESGGPLSPDSLLKLEIALTNGGAQMIDQAGRVGVTVPKA